MVEPPAYRRRRRPARALLPLLGLLAACAVPELNSERIAARYGSYAVTVIAQDARWRITSLESRHNGRAITRTLALVRFEQAPRPALAAEDRRIRAGASIGKTFRDAGWQIDKPLLYTGALGVGAEARGLAARMDIALPAALAVHVYRLVLRRAGQRYSYATIVELHHPDYLDVTALREIYGAADDTGAARAAPLLRELAGVLAQLPYDLVH